MSVVGAFSVMLIAHLTSKLSQAITQITAANYSSYTAVCSTKNSFFSFIGDCYPLFVARWLSCSIMVIIIDRISILRAAKYCKARRSGSPRANIACAEVIYWVNSLKPFRVYAHSHTHKAHPEVLWRTCVVCQFQPLAGYLLNRSGQNSNVLGTGSRGDDNMPSGSSGKASKAPSCFCSLHGQKLRAEVGIWYVCFFLGGLWQ